MTPSMNTIRTSDYDWDILKAYLIRNSPRNTKNPTNINVTVLIQMEALNKSALRKALAGDTPSFAQKSKAKQLITDCLTDAGP